MAALTFMGGGFEECDDHKDDFNANHEARQKHQCHVDERFRPASFADFQRSSRISIDAHNTKTDRYGGDDHSQHACEALL